MLFTARRHLWVEGPWKKPFRGKVQRQDFPTALENPATARDFHFSHRPGYGGELFRLTSRKILRQDRLGTTIATSVDL
jgi:hypothetical protein